MNFLIYTCGQKQRFGIEDSKLVLTQSFLFLSFVLHIYIFCSEIQHNGKKRLSS